MPTFTTILQKFDKKGEKTGWTYIELPIDVTDVLKPGQKTSFRVKGTLDNLEIKQVALIPMGRSGDSEGAFIMPVNATMRRSIRKEEGASVRITIDVDDSPLPLSADFLACLQDDPDAFKFFETLPKGHQNYFSKWIEDAKTTETKANRITKALRGLSMGMGYGEMIRYFKNQQ
ncbi:DUF1905 domain-containing protein [Spirosoma aureum]|uniref:DUF1905 domain-containing protein n=1 Tax=Spirosoma aureum TaxID=2692134 RepID=A0A6G9AUW9_9BACT|nr:YdeI/OmpD-associated family protein [Spirosoma aureum]QIP16144.1 DUF1905 domain-containing protein [Spirosoma aureum]